MDYVDLFVVVSICVVFAGFAWCFGTMWETWKNDYKTVEAVQTPRSVSQGDIDGLKQRLSQLEAWACQDRIDDQQMWESIKILDLKIGARFRIKRVETTLYFDNSAPKVTVGLSGCFTWQDGVKAIEKIVIENQHLGLQKVRRDGNPAWMSTCPVCSNSENRWLVSYELEEITL